MTETNPTSAASNAEINRLRGKLERIAGDDQADFGKIWDGRRWVRVGDFARTALADHPTSPTPVSAETVGLVEEARHLMEYAKSAVTAGSSDTMAVSAMAEVGAAWSRLATHLSRLSGQGVGETALHILFDGPPGHEAGRFIEVETPDGRSVHAGEWRERKDHPGWWELVIQRCVIQPPATTGQSDTTPGGHDQAFVDWLLKGGHLNDEFLSPGGGLKAQVRGFEETQSAFTVMKEAFFSSAPPPASIERSASTTPPAFTEEQVEQAAAGVHGAMSPAAERAGFVYETSGDAHKDYCRRIAIAALATLTPPPAIPNAGDLARRVREQADRYIPSTVALRALADELEAKSEKPVERVGLNALLAHYTENRDYLLGIKASSALTKAYGKSSLTHVENIVRELTLIRDTGSPWENIPVENLVKRAAELEGGKPNG